MKLRVEIKKLEEKTSIKDLKYETNKYIQHDCSQFQTLTSFGDIILNDNITISEAAKKQRNL